MKGSPHPVFPPISPRPQRGVTSAGQECTQSVPVIGNFGCTYGACVRKKEFEGKGWLMRQKEELIWDRRGAEREHGTRSTARLLIFPFNHPASLARVRSALPSASLVPTDSSAGETSNTPHTALIKGGALGVPCPRDDSFLDPPWGPRSTVRTGRCNQPPSVAYPSSVGWKHNQWYHATHFDSFT